MTTTPYTQHKQRLEAAEANETRAREAARETDADAGFAQAQLDRYRRENAIRLSRVLAGIDSRLADEQDVIAAARKHFEVTLVEYAATLVSNVPLETAPTVLLWAMTRPDFRADARRVLEAAGLLDVSDADFDAEVERRRAEIGVLRAAASRARQEELQAMRERTAVIKGIDGR